MLPSIGIHHHNQYNSFPLADDIMEPYRPFVDEIPRIPGKLPDQPVATDSFVESKSYEYAADITLSDIAKFQRGSSL